MVFSVYVYFIKFVEKPQQKENIVAFTVLFFFAVELFFVVLFSLKTDCILEKKRIKSGKNKDQSFLFFIATNCNFVHKNVNPC